MDTALPQKFLFILDRNLAKANCTGNRVCASCDIVVLGYAYILSEYALIFLDFENDWCLVYSNSCKKISIKY